MQTFTAHELDKAKREPLLDYHSHYDFVITEVFDTYEVVGEGFKRLAAGNVIPVSAIMMSSRHRAWDSLNHLLISYSAGNPLDELKAFYPTVLHYWEVFAQYDKQFDDSPEAGGRRVPHLDLYDFDYAQAVQLLSMGLLLGHADLMPRWAPILDYENDDPDILIETLMAPFVPGRRPGVTYTRNLPYKKLQKVLDAKPEQRPRLMAKYLDDWYDASRREGYHDSHDCPNFTGYWSWEAAAITWLLQIDDSSFRDKPFYPAELVDYAREQYSPQIAVSRTETGRCEADQPCPKAGMWWTPAKRDARQFFEAGDILPNFPDSDYGATIWYRERE